MLRTATFGLVVWLPPGSPGPSCPCHLGTAAMLSVYTHVNLWLTVSIRAELPAQTPRELWSRGWKKAFRFPVSRASLCFSYNNAMCYEPGLSPQELQVHGRTKGRQAQDPAHLAVCSGRRSVMMADVPVSRQQVRALRCQHLCQRRGGSTLFTCDSGPALFPWCLSPPPITPSLHIPLLPFFPPFFSDP